jgi:hypothetical protein
MAFTKLHGLHGLTGVSGQETVIKMIKLVDHFFDGKLVLDELLAAAAKATAERWVASQFQQVSCDGRDVAGSNEKTGFALQTNFVGTVEVVGDNRPGSSQRLWQCAGESFAVRKMRQAIHDSDVPGHFSRRNEAGESDFIAQVHALSLDLQLCPQWSVANKEEAGLRMPRKKRPESLEEVCVALERREATELADDKCGF